MDRNDILRSIENHRTGLAPLLSAYEDLTKATKGTGEGGKDRPFTAEEWSRHEALGTDINRINQAIATDRAALKALNMSEASDDETAQKLGLSDRSKLPMATDEYMDNFLQFARVGFDQRACSPDVYKALSTVAPSTGGVLIPTVIENNILMEALSQSPLMEISDVTFTSSIHTQIPFIGTIGVLAPRKEAEAYLKTEPALSVKSIDIYNYGGMFPVSQELMEDADGLDAAFRRVWAEAFAETIEEYGWKGTAGFNAFVDQAGNAAPVTLASRVCPGILSLGTGIVPAVVNSAATTITADDIIKLKQAVKPAARRDGVYAISSDFETKALLLKDTTGQPIWRPNLIAGQPSMINGSAYHVSDRLDAVAATKTPALFGSFKRAHEIKIRKGLTVKKSDHYLFGNGMIAVAADVRWGAMVRFANYIARLNTPA
ncbi:phage major capsid protein [Luteolibacter sp. GHJ8]|uniref:Phage major capsid protein n=1 Tax=Luteolibacter rhizosphaerae TaxID=2989719 RepID=A0ABT3G9U3_9BACT|nr:phage major capsid protein [Luteolibacter rhizosphaerae]MCW1916611.1 phage major capsid protein [Luteolibacter rhizosphaerae]